jgi:restriction system protein
MKWLALPVAESSPVLNPIARALSGLAGWFAILFLLPIPFSLINARRRRWLVHGQADIDSICALPWKQFEQLVGEVYRRQGYDVIERAGAGPDGGIDLELRSKDQRLVVQCKRWRARTIGVELVRQLYGAMVGQEAHAAIFVTSGRYTPDAIAFASDKPIKLVDGQRLVHMLRDVQPRTSKPMTSQSPLVAAPPVATTCPRCGGAMVHRLAKRGAERGRVFWGCSSYPLCAGTRPQ